MSNLEPELQITEEQREQLLRHKSPPSARSWHVDARTIAFIILGFQVAIVAFISRRPIFHHAVGPIGHRAGFAGTGTTAVRLANAGPQTITGVIFRAHIRIIAGGAAGVVELLFVRHGLPAAALG